MVNPRVNSRVAKAIRQVERPFLAQFFPPSVTDIDAGPADGRAHGGRMQTVVAVADGRLTHGSLQWFALPQFRRKAKCEVRTVSVGSAHEPAIVALAPTR